MIISSTTLLELDRPLQSLETDRNSPDFEDSTTFRSA